MKKNINILATSLFASMLLLASCAEGENSDMPPESTTGNTQETGVEITGDLPETDADDTTEYVNEVIGDDNAATEDTTL